MSVLPQPRLARCAPTARSYTAHGRRVALRLRASPGGKQDGVLYAGTFDIGTGTQILSQAMGLPAPNLRNPTGFDLYWTVNGELWLPVSIDGFRDRYNYGTRSFVTDPATGDLFMGTANPFYGCQIWKKPAWP